MAEVMRIERALASIDAVTQLKPRKFWSVDTFVGSMTPPAWTVDGLIQSAYLYSMTALTGHGKTSVVTLIALCAASGRMIAGHKTKQVRVLFLAGENPEDVKGRFAATAQLLGIEITTLAGWITVRPGAASLSSIVEEVREEAARSGGFGLVIVDTSAAFFSYTDENDNVAAAAHARDLRELTTVNGSPAVLVPCHPTKSAERSNLTPKGGSGFINEVDANLTLWNDGEALELSHTKMRGPGFEPLQFLLKRVEINGHHDTEGRPVISVAAQPITDADADHLLKKREQDESRVLYAMLRHPNVSMAEWATSCGWKASNKSKVFRIIQRLKEDRLVRTYRGRWVLTSQGKTEAEHVG